MLRLEEEDIYAGIATSGSGGGDTPESAKGSFNASTQQLTLNYDYLVEKINSSTLSSESKASAISTLDGNDLEIDMTTDILSAQGLENAPCWGFGEMTFGIQIVVDKQNPVNLKFFIGTESGTSMATYKGMADLFTALGQTMTPEQVEEAYGQYVVDENVCTVSGTLGNFSVEFN